MITLSTVLYDALVPFLLDLAFRIQFSELLFKMVCFRGSGVLERNFWLIL